jgi:hypothetical protein
MKNKQMTKKDKTLNFAGRCLLRYVQLPVAWHFTVALILLISVAWKRAVLN